MTISTYPPHASLVRSTSCSSYRSSFHCTTLTLRHQKEALMYEALCEWHSEFIMCSFYNAVYIFTNTAYCIEAKPCGMKCYCLPKEKRKTDKNLINKADHTLECHGNMGCERKNERITRSLGVCVWRVCAWTNFSVIPTPSKTSEITKNT